MSLPENGEQTPRRLVNREQLDKQRGQLEGHIKAQTGKEKVFGPLYNARYLADYRSRLRPLYIRCCQ